MSNRISVWSQTKPIGTIRNLRDAGGRAVANQLAQIRADPRLRRAARRSGTRRSYSRCRPAPRRRAPSRRLRSAYGSPASITRTGRLCAVNTTRSSRRGCGCAHALGEGVEQQRMVVERAHRARTARPAGSAAAAASSTSATLSVENCGASGMPTMRVTPLRRRARAIASLMNGRQLRMPTATGTSAPSRARKRGGLRQGEIGERRSAADRLVVVRASRATSSATAAGRRARAAGTPASRRATTACRAPSGERRCSSTVRIPDPDFRFAASADARTARAPARARPASTAGCRVRD